MTRNTVKRVEVAAPVYSPTLQNRIRGIFELMLHDNVKARVENVQGVYQSVHSGEKSYNSQEVLYQQSYDRAVKKTGLSV